MIAATQKDPWKIRTLVEGSPTDPVIFATGQTVWESLIAAEMLTRYDIHPTVVDVPYFRPFDARGVSNASRNKKIFVAEAHNPYVGLASAVASALGIGTPHKGITQMGITGYVPSGSIEAQKKHCGLLGEQIFERVRNIIGR